MLKFILSPILNKMKKQKATLPVKVESTKKPEYTTKAYLSKREKQKVRRAVKNYKYPSESFLVREALKKAGIL